MSLESSNFGQYHNSPLNIEGIQEQSKYFGLSKQTRINVKIDGAMVSIAAEKLAPGKTTLNWFERLTHTLIEAKNGNEEPVLMKVNRNSLVKRLGIDKKDLQIAEKVGVARLTSFVSGQVRAITKNVVDLKNRLELHAAVSRLGKIKEGATVVDHAQTRADLEVIGKNIEGIRNIDNRTKFEQDYKNLFSALEKGQPLTSLSTFLSGISSETLGVQKMTTLQSEFKASEGDLPKMEQTFKEISRLMRVLDPSEVVVGALHESIKIAKPDSNESIEKLRGILKDDRLMSSLERQKDIYKDISKEVVQKRKEVAKKTGISEEQVRHLSIHGSEFARLHLKSLSGTRLSDEDKETIQNFIQMLIEHEEPVPGYEFIHRLFKDADIKEGVTHLLKSELGNEDIFFTMNALREMEKILNSDQSKASMKPNNPFGWEVHDTGVITIHSDKTADGKYALTERLQDVGKWSETVDAFSESDIGKKNPKFTLKALKEIRKHIESRTEGKFIDLLSPFGWEVSAQGVVTIYVSGTKIDKQGFVNLESFNLEEIARHSSKPIKLEIVMDEVSPVARHSDVNLENLSPIAKRADDLPIQSFVKVRSDEEPTQQEEVETASPSHEGFHSDVDPENLSSNTNRAKDLSLREMLEQDIPVRGNEHLNELAKVGLKEEVLKLLESEWGKKDMRYTLDALKEINECIQKGIFKKVLRTEDAPFGWLVTSGGRVSIYYNFTRENGRPGHGAQQLGTAIKE